MANTFLAAQGKEVGKSLCEHDLARYRPPPSRRARKAGCEIVLPVDVVVADKFKANAPASRPERRCEVGPDEMILDIGPPNRSSARPHRLEPREDPALERSLRRLRAGRPSTTAPSPARRGRRAADQGREARLGRRRRRHGRGAGQAGVADDFTYVSTAGGAFLEWLEGKPLPGVGPSSNPKSPRRNRPSQGGSHGPHHARQLLDHAAEHDYGVPAFNINNMEQALAIMAAADATDAPVIIQASRGARSYANDVMLKHMMDAVTEIYPHIPSACISTTATSRRPA
jgi:hypothetical protein